MSSTNNRSFGPPPPITELTLEQDFKIRQIEDALNRPDTRKDDIITIFMALQRQNFVLANNIRQLVSEWNNPKDHSITDEVLSNLGITFETKD
jgi:hypothetical protein